MKFKHLAFISAALICSQQASAVDKNKADRWFEVEVILFSQLGDKAQLKEQFPENTALPKYRKIIDLLGPYLNPNITSLKQLLPSCDASGYPESFINQAITAVKEQPYYVEKSLGELEAAIVEKVGDTTANSLKSQFSDGTDTQYYRENTKDKIDQVNNLQQSNSSEQADVESPTISVQPPVLSLEELAQRSVLLAQAEAEFSSIQLSYANETASFPELICTISIDQFNQLNQSENESYFESYTAFNLDKVPSRINNNEDIYSDEDYLLNKESLQLQDIVKQIARSKNFRPLLHFGWRQKTKTKQLAVPVKVFAGENFGYNYQQELQKFQQQLKQTQDQEDTLNKTLLENNIPMVELSEETLKQQAIAERLQELVVKLPNISNDTVSLLKEIDQEIINTDAILNSTSMLAAPVEPPQDWTLDGFLKVEVDFYLHITADFNVMNMSLAQLATQKLLPTSNERKSTSLKTINFKQDRRVRSKEIHYFDHPYIGMVIRILPYKKPIKEVEESASIQ